MLQVHDYTWIFVVALLLAFVDGYSIGANDVANSFSTSVGSGSLTLLQACIIAVFTEFGGAILLGSGTAETIRSGILQLNLFASQPEMLMFAMICALFGSSTWVLIATRYGLPVSTTHSIVGAIIGVGIAAFGGQGINWGFYPSAFDGVAKIITSWFLSPVAAGILASLIFLSTRYGVLQKPNSFRRGLIAIPVYFFITFLINIFFIVFKSPRIGYSIKNNVKRADGTIGDALYKVNLTDPKLGSILATSEDYGIIVGIPFAIATATALFAYFFFGTWIKRIVEGGENGLNWYHIPVIFWIKERKEPAAKENESNVEMVPTNTSLIPAESKESEAVQEVIIADPVPKYEDDAAKKESSEETTEDAAKPIVATTESDKSTAQEMSNETPASTDALAATEKQDKPKSALLGKIKGAILHGVSVEVRDHDAEELKDMHDRAVKFDDNTERLYSFLQVCTAAFASFSHGSNDVANSVGPLATVFAIWSTATLPGSKTGVEYWILALGGFAIDVGLATYGYNVMRSLGNQLTYHSPSRGFSMELGTSLTVLTASFLGLPVSTTHCITGATAGVGLCNGDIKAINWKLLLWCFLSWIVTLPAAGLMAGLTFAFAIYSPNFIPKYSYNAVINVTDPTGANVYSQTLTNFTVPSTAMATVTNTSTLFGNWTFGSENFTSPSNFTATVNFKIPGYSFP